MLIAPGGGKIFCGDEKAGVLCDLLQKTYTGAPYVQPSSTRVLLPAGVLCVDDVDVSEAHVLAAIRGHGRHVELKSDLNKFSDRNRSS